MNLSLATKYRPTDWDEVVEQGATIKVLKQQLETNNLRNCYLFHGATGCGKTTIARIFANKINQGVGEPIEIDAASNNGVDNVRAIIDEAQLRSVIGTYKIYIIDECHMLSNAAWNAMLKLIEEPPMYTIFIFCTTDVQKVPATILNRVQTYNFTRISTKSIQERLIEVCRKEKILINFEEAAEYIAKISNGGMRDALSLLDKCVSFTTDLSIENVLYALGNYSYKSFFELLNSLLDGDEAKVFEAVENYQTQGKDLKLFVDQFLNFCIDIAKYAIFKRCDVLKIPSTMQQDLDNVINFENPSSYYNYVMDKLLELKNAIKNDVDLKSTITIYLLQVARCV